MNKVKEIIRFCLLNSIYTFKANNADYTFLYYSISKIINPILQLLFFYYIQLYIRNSQDIDIYIIGNLMLLSIPNSVFSLGRVLNYDRTYGTLKLIEISEKNKFLIYISRAFFYIVESFVTVLISLFFSIFILNLKINLILTLKLLLIILITNFSLMGFGAFLGSFGLILRSVLMLVNTFYLILIAFSGANYSIDSFPIIIQKIVLILPLQRGVEVAKYLYRTGKVLDVLLLKEFMLGCAFYIIGYFSFECISRKAKKNGNFDIY